jgi:hypothetical protein
MTPQVGLSKGFRVFLVASTAALWLMVAHFRGGGVATGAVVIVVASVIGVGLAFVAAAYAGLLAHELGHALAAVAFTPGRPLIENGKPPRSLRLRLGRIEAHLGIKPGAAHCLCPTPPRSRAVTLAIYGAGPVASALVAGLWLWVAARFGGHNHLVLQFALLEALIETGHALGNLKPREFERADDYGRPRILFSDGAHIAAALKNRPLVQSAGRRVRPTTSERTGAVVAAALQAAPTDSVGTEHLLAGLSVADDRTRDLLRAHGWTAGYELAGQISESQVSTPALKRVFKAAHGLLPLSGHAKVEPEHLLLALLGSGETSARTALEAADVDLEGLRSALVAKLAV